MNKKAKREYMREYMRKYYKKHSKKILAQGKVQRRLKLLRKKTKAAFKAGNIKPFKLGKGIEVTKGTLLAAVGDGTVRPIKRIPQSPQLPSKIQIPKIQIQHQPEENPCCPHCGTLRVWKLECPQCFRDPEKPHKPPSPRPSPALIEPNNYEKEES